MNRRPVIRGAAILPAVVHAAIGLCEIGRSSEVGQPGLDLAEIEVVVSEEQPLRSSASPQRSRKTPWRQALPETQGQCNSLGLSPAQFGRQRYTGTKHTALDEKD
jgi:hypothetical protein